MLSARRTAVNLQLQPTNPCLVAKQLHMTGVFPLKCLAAELLYTLSAQTTGPQGRHHQLQQPTMPFLGSLVCHLLVLW